MRSGPDDVLIDNQPEEPPVFASRVANVGLDYVALKVTRHKEVTGCDERIVLIRVPPGDRGVTRAIGELVVIEIVGWYPGKGRIAVENGQAIGEEIVQPSASECGAVVMVVAITPAERAK